MSTEQSKNTTCLELIPLIHLLSLKRHSPRVTADTLVLLLLCLLSPCYGSKAQVAIAADASVATDLASPAASSPADYAVVSRGPNHAIRERISYESTRAGLVPRVHRVVELASGLNHLANGEWVESRDDFEITPEGYAIARHCQHQLIVSPNLADAAGVLDCQGLDGKRLRSAILGLELFDPVSGKSLQIAAAKDCQGQLTATNEITFFNAFQGLNANVRIRNERGRFHQEILLNEKVTSEQLKTLGFSEQSVRLEIWTEFLEAPSPTIESYLLNGETDPIRRAAMIEPDVIDDSLEFGDALKMAHGTAFVEGEPGKSVTVFKRWFEDSGRRFLIEACNYVDLKPLLSSLPVTRFAEYKINRVNSSLLAHDASPSINKPLFGSHSLSPSTLVHRQLPEREKSSKSVEFKMAKLDPVGAKSSLPQLNLDYTMLSGTITNYCFQRDTTYWISSALTILGTVTWEGNAVLKYSRGASVSLVGSSIPLVVKWLPVQYSPIVLTAVDDGSVGESLSGSAPSGYYANPALSLSVVTNSTFSNLRIAYAQQGFYVYQTDLTLKNAQFVNCQNGILLSMASAKLRNVLFANVGTVLNNLIYTGLDAQNVTFANSLYLATPLLTNMTWSLAFTNCIFANVTNLPGTGFNVSGAYNAFYNTTSFGSSTITTTNYPFQTVGGGSYYLANSSSLRDAGTTNIDSGLDLSKRTTYPPLVYSNATIAVDTNLGPQALRDTDTPDLGYEYDPLDYAFGGSTANGNLTFPAGTAVGWFRTTSGWTHAGHGIHIGDTKVVTFDGHVDAPDYWVRCSVVQEGCNGLWQGGYGPGGLTGWAWPDITNAPQVVARFTRFSTVANDWSHYRDDWGWLIVNATSCEYYGGCIWGYNGGHHYTNCLFDRTLTGFGTDHAQSSFFMRNCTVRGGQVTPSRSGDGINAPVVIQQCIFDGAAVTTSGDGPGVTYYDFNAYQSTNYTTPLGLHDLLLTNFNWQTSWLGNFYLPTNSVLINTGGITADLIGLYHFTTQTNQVKETNSLVDIGYHYVAVDTNGNPIDTDGDGVPDYLADKNGNGLLDFGEIPFGITIENPSNGSLLY